MWKINYQIISQTPKGSPNHIYVSATNIPLWLDVPIGQSTIIANESKTSQKCGRPIDAKDITTRKREKKKKKIFKRIL